MSASPNQLSFLPDDYLERKASRRANLVCGTLSLLVIGAIGSAFYLKERSMRDINARAAEVDKDYATAAARIEQVQTLHSRQRQIVQHAELAAALVERIPRSNILAEFTNCMPPGASLLELTMDSRPRVTAAPTGTAFEMKKRELEARQKAATSAPETPKLDVYLKITGIAENDVQVSDFISKLNQSRLFRDVNLVVSEMYMQDKVADLRRFQIEMMLNPDAEVREVAADGKTAAVEVENGPKK
jgi:Tfp pilus assembly protein PilN